MARIPFSISISDVDIESLNTEDDFNREAARLLPEVTKQLATQSAEAAWDSAQCELKKIPGFTLNNSAHDKAAFIRDAAKSFRLEPEGQRKTEDAIVDQLKELKVQHEQDS